MLQFIHGGTALLRNHPTMINGCSHSFFSQAALPQALLRSTPVLLIPECSINDDCPYRFPGDVVVKRSIALGQPVIFAAMNYRLHAFGFLGGKEVKEAGIGNLALHDRTGLSSSAYMSQP